VEGDQQIMPLLLLALSEGIPIPIDKPILLVGRSDECDVVIPSRKISRRHCVLASREHSLLVRDLGSTNGIRVNGVRVTYQVLQPGDLLQIAHFLYQLIHKTTEHTGQSQPPTDFLPVPPEASYLSS
jgi:pSer/pThr/pTyr-binding forkhead associated (FHA) protein